MQHITSRYVTAFHWNETHPRACRLADRGGSEWEVKIARGAPAVRVALTCAWRGSTSLEEVRGTHLLPDESVELDEQFCRAALQRFRPDLKRREDEKALVCLVDDPHSVSPRWQDKQPMIKQRKKTHKREGNANRFRSSQIGAKTHSFTILTSAE
eukprot:4108929-Pleurochrysis_carterae.AAC.2